VTAVRVAGVILILAVVIIAPRWPGIRDQWREQRLRNALGDQAPCRVP
jgi:hypothetical protein